MSKTRLADGASSCPVCSWRRAIEVSSRDRNGEPLRTLACVRCGLFRSDPLPAAAELEQFHETTYRTAYKGNRQPAPRRQARALWLALRRWERLRTHLNGRRRILDAGCASGEWLYLLQRRQFEVLGLEVDPLYAGFGEREYGVTILRESARTTCFPPGSFDAITLFHVLEHVPEPLALLTRLRSWLAPAGLLILETPNLASPHQHPAKRFHRAHPIGFTVESFRYAAARAGWNILDLTLLDHGRNLLAVLAPAPGPAPLAEPPAAAALPRRDTPSAVLAYYAQPLTYFRWTARIWQIAREWWATRTGLQGRALAERLLAQQTRD